ncbi:MAG TPA: pantetheine-phosphate adenylyltransferase, partial [Iamia sp.]|nr:pantetheine-phosphate adenylyltransferase [Iamia sp.]
MTTVLYPGSFDPVHNGHIEIIDVAAGLFDDVVVAALRNPQKGEPMFDVDERVKMLEESTSHLPNVRIVGFSKLVVEVAQDAGADFIIKGLRAVSDFDYELQMAQMNAHLTGVETVFVVADPQYGFVSS